ncbi:MAG TPA: energy transducer TonB, partial [Bryobacteraceae bacterium]
DVSVRTNLRAQFWTRLDEGIWNLNKALELNPQYDDAMAYMNLLVRERADLRDTKDEYTRDIAEADQWVQKALATKKMKAQMGVGGHGGMLAAPPPPPPPPPPPARAQGAEAAQDSKRIRVGGEIQQRMLISQTAPVYPPLAKQARIQGTVLLSIVVGKDGSVNQVTVMQGHPLLVPAALEAVRQWRYQTTLLNGDPVEVATMAEVSFALPQ